jgi:hypothetical protein
MRYQIRREARSNDVRQRSNQETNTELEIPLPFAQHLHGKEYSLKLGLAQNRLSPLVSGGEGGIRTHGTRKGSTVFEHGTARSGQYRSTTIRIV